MNKLLMIGLIAGVLATSAWADTVAKRVDDTVKSVVTTTSNTLTTASTAIASVSTATVGMIDAVTESTKNVDVKAAKAVNGVVDNTGKVIGENFNSAWATVSDSVSQFANSDAGKLTAIIVGIKLIGTECTEILDSGMGILTRITRGMFGAIVMLLGILVPFANYKRITSPTRVVKSIKGFWIFKSIEYGEEVSGVEMDNDQHIKYMLYTGIVSGLILFIGLCIL